MSGKTFNIITQDSETGAQNEPQPPVTHQEPQEPQEVPAEESVGPVIDWDKPQE